MSIESLAGAALCLGFGAAIAASAQTTTPVAYVYVQTSSGVAAYSAAASGALTKISGSPFKTAGLIAGSTPTVFFTVGTDFIHSYPVASNGAINAQESQIDSQNYSGANCGQAQAGGAGLLDHTGNYFYLLLSNTNANCAAYQTYKKGSNGQLTFENSTELGVEPGGFTNVPTILGNEAFAYAISGFSHNAGITAFTRESSGALQLIPFGSFQETDPSGVQYDAELVAADPANHLAVALAPNDSNPLQLASYTADSHGNITSTNPSSSLPTVNFDIASLSMSPSGALLAVTGGDRPVSVGGDGLQIFHFNGANPISFYKTLLSNVDIESAKWDTSNHLYAMSNSTNRLYVYTVTPTSISQAPGSPYTITAPTALVVRSH